MAVGQKLKKEVTEKILQAFEGSFLYNDGKEIRINGMEDGAELQIKVTLTCAKNPVSIGSDTALPGENIKQVAVEEKPVIHKDVPVEISQEEKDNIQNLLKSIGL